MWHMTNVIEKSVLFFVTFGTTHIFNITIIQSARERKIRYCITMTKRLDNKYERVLCVTIIRGTGRFF